MKNFKSKNTLCLINILLLIVVFTFFVDFSFSSEDRSGVIRGGFVIDNSGQNRQTEQPPVTPNQQTSRADNARSGSETEVQQNTREQTQRPNQTGNNSGTVVVKKKPEQKKNNVQNEDEIDYKKIYFMLISALILFVYLIFGLKKRSRRKSSGAGSNRYLR
jgi:hypothetical protein